MDGQWIDGQTTQQSYIVGKGTKTHLNNTHLDSSQEREAQTNTNKLKPKQDK